MGKWSHPLSHLHLEEEEDEINLTPLIDVVFVVLILFILIAPLIEIDRIALAPASSKKKENVSLEQKESIKLYVHADNTIWLNGTPLQAKELLNALKKERQRVPDAQLQLFHDKKAYFGTYQMVKNMAESAGFERLDLILKPE